MKKPMMVVVAAVVVLFVRSLSADTHNVDAGDTATLSGITESSRFTKTGGGTLVLTGNNSLATVTVSAGSVNIHGGTTTVSGSGSNGAYGNAAFVNQGGEFDMSELSSSWTVKYAADGKSAYLRRRIGMRVVVR